MIRNQRATFWLRELNKWHYHLLSFSLTHNTHTHLSEYHDEYSNYFTSECVIYGLVQLHFNLALGRYLALMRSPIYSHLLSDQKKHTSDDSEVIFMIVSVPEKSTARLIHTQRQADTLKDHLETFPSTFLSSRQSTNHHSVAKLFLLATYVGRQVRIYIFQWKQFMQAITSSCQPSLWREGDIFI